MKTEMKKDNTQVIVIGGGASGMMAALAAAKEGCRVLLLEKNEKLGKKLYITGKGRCNLTNAADMDTVMQNVCSNPRFLYSAFFALDNRAVLSLFADLGLRTKTERGNRVFPQSDHASDVTAALARGLSRFGVQVRLSAKVDSLLTEPVRTPDEPAQTVRARGQTKQTMRVTGVCVGKERLYADRVIVATGGVSYPSTGSDGDGYRFAGASGHRLVQMNPALVPLVLAEPDAARLQGLSLKNVVLCVRDGKKILYREMGEMLFTHFGVSGPLVLAASSRITRAVNEKGKRPVLEIDLKPALSEEQLHRRLVREFAAGANRQLKNVMPSLLPARLAEVFLARSGVPAEKKCSEITRGERESLVRLLKCFPYTVTGTRGFAEAIITQGGVSVRDVDPSTMGSKRVRGLYFAGETLDVDAMTGGFNLQIAWSTGYLAGISAAQACRTEDAIGGKTDEQYCD